jgi:16S rRNA (guanine(1405)-N(7))-methyltransferase
MKKYTHLYPKLLARITAEESTKKDSDKAVKKRLHQLYGAYMQPATCKKTAALLDLWESVGDKPPPVADILRLHASTRERLSFYPDFYQFIVGCAGFPESVMDLGCGFNPFSLPFLLGLLPSGFLRAYYAYDIDTQQAGLLNRFFSMYNLPPYAGCIDLTVDLPETEALPQTEADWGLMLKLLPVLEAQAAGSGFRLIRSLRVKYLVVTYPLKSLGGNEKGMGKFYRHTFETAYNAGELSPFILLREGQTGTELVYVLKRSLLPNHTQN